MRILGLLAAILLLTADAALAEDAAPSCAPPLSPGQCWWTWTKDASAEDVAKSGDELFRFYFSTPGAPGPFEADDAVFDVRRSRDGHVTLRARQTNTAHREIRRELPQSAWDRLLERWRAYKRYSDESDADLKRLEAAQKKRQAAEAASGKQQEVDVEYLLNNLIPTSCSDGDSIDFDTAVAGKIERRTTASCDTQATDDLFDELSHFLLSSVPGCDRLAQGQQHACFLLGGDRVTAAGAVPGLMALEKLQCKALSVKALSDLFAPDVMLTIDGNATSPSQAAQRFLDMRCGRRDYQTKFYAIAGASSGDVAVTGRIGWFLRSGKGEVFEAAPFRQTCRREGTALRIVSWTIDRPAAVPQ